MVEALVLRKSEEIEGAVRERAVRSKRSAAVGTGFQFGGGNRLSTDVDRSERSTFLLQLEVLVISNEIVALLLQLPGIELALLLSKR